MSERGEPDVYEVVWKSGHIERIQAHQVIWPQDNTGLIGAMFGGNTLTERRGDPRILFHADINGRWSLVLSAIEDDVRTVRLVTQEETIPGATS